MSSATKKAKSFSIEPEIDDYVSSTKGAHSASERINELLRRAMHAEKYERLEAEAESFFRTVRKDERAETRAFQSAALRTFERD